MSCTRQLLSTFYLCQNGSLRETIHMKMSSSYKFIYKWLNLFWHERFCARTRFEKERKGKLAQGLCHQCIRISHTYDSVARCPPFRILYPTKKKQTPRNCLTKNQNCAVPSCQLEVIGLTALPLLRCGSLFRYENSRFGRLVICCTRNELKSCYNRNFTTDLWVT